MRSVIMTYSYPVLGIGSIRYLVDIYKRNGQVLVQWGTEHEARRFGPEGEAVRDWLAGQIEPNIHLVPENWNGTEEPNGCTGA